MVFRLNYDSQRRELPSFAVRRLGTLIAYRGMVQGAVLVLTGIDHIIEGMIHSAMPEWFIDLTTAI